LIAHGRENCVVRTDAFVGKPTSPVAVRLACEKASKVIGYFRPEITHVELNLKEIAQLFWADETTIKRLSAHE